MIFCIKILFIVKFNFKNKFYKIFYQFVLKHFNIFITSINY